MDSQQSNAAQDRLRFWLLTWADTLVHRLRLYRLPGAWRVCDAYDLALGAPDTPENFPRRHGVR